MKIDKYNENRTYKTIGEVAKMLKLVNKKNGSLSTHTIRFWEKEFKQIKPKILNGGRRYYDKETIELLKRIHFLLKEQGMTLNGVKKILDKKEFLKLDETLNQSIKAQELKLKIKNISKLINNLKK